MSPLRIPAISIEQHLTVLFAILLGIFFVGYALYQGRNFIEGPTISLLGEPAIMQNSHEVVLKGVARNVIILTLNGKEIHTDEAGVFEQTLTLERGYSIMRLEAEDRYGRKTAVERQFVREHNLEVRS
jgi:hypothetical protein